jgi:hypothetical protein
MSKSLFDPINIANIVQLISAIDSDEDYKHFVTEYISFLSYILKRMEHDSNAVCQIDKTDIIYTKYLDTYISLLNKNFNKVSIINNGQYGEHGLFCIKVEW